MFFYVFNPSVRHFAPKQSLSSAEQMVTKANVEIHGPQRMNICASDPLMVVFLLSM